MIHLLRWNVIEMSGTESHVLIFTKGEWIQMIDFQVSSEIVTEIIEQALPMGIVFIFAERIVNMFLSFAFPKTFKGGL